jgi:acyl carrier protein
MEKDEIEAMIGRMVADLFLLAEGEVSADLSPEVLPAWDSLQHLNLVMAVEQEFGLQLSPEEIQGMKSVGDMVDVVRRRLASADV